MTWGLAWFVGGASWLGINLWGAASLRMVLSLAGGIGVAGLLTGAGFAVVLSLAGRRYRLEDFGYIRMASWGALAGVLVWTPLAVLTGVGVLLPILGVVGTLGALSSSGMLALARMSDEVGELDGGLQRPAISGE